MKNDAEKDSFEEMPESIRIFTVIGGMTCGGMALGYAYGVIRAVAATIMLSGYGFFGYALVVALMKAASVVFLCVDACLMYRMYRRWSESEADRYFTVLLVMTAGLIISGLVGGLVVPTWLSRVPEMVVDNAAVGIMSAAAFAFICRKEGIVLSRKFSVERVREDLGWFLRG